MKTGRMTQYCMDIQKNTSDVAKLHENTKKRTEVRFRGAFVPVRTGSTGLAGSVVQRFPAYRSDGGYRVGDMAFARRFDCAAAPPLPVNPGSAPQR